MVSSLEDLEEKKIYQYLEELRDGRLSHYSGIIQDLQFRFNLTEEESMDVLNQWFGQYGTM